MPTTTNARAGPSRVVQRKKRVYAEEDVIDLTTPSPEPPPRRRAPPPRAMELEESTDEEDIVTTEPFRPPPLPPLAPIFAKSKSAPAPKTRSPLQKTLSARSNPSNSKAKAAPPAEPASKMPTYRYSEFLPRPTVLYLKKEEEVDEALEGLDGPLGFDLEWKVSRGKERPAALVQLADASMILLIQVTSMPRFPPKLKALIENPTILKLGVNIRNDGVKLHRDYGVLARALVELGALAGAADARFAAAYRRPIVSLAKCTAWYMRRALDKGPVRTSDWERPLSREQVQYAANDAHCAVMIYKRIVAVARAAKVALDPLAAASDLMAELAPPPPAAPSSGPGAGAADGAPPRVSSNGKVRPQHLRAYTLWRAGRGLLDICIQLRSAADPLRASTVVSYVVGALEADPALPFEMDKLQAFVKGDAGGWHRHGETVLGFGRAGRGGG